MHAINWVRLVGTGSEWSPETDMPEWVRALVYVFQHIGVGSAVLAFIGFVIWRLLPHFTKVLQARARAANHLADAVPKAMIAFERIAHGVETLLGDRHRESLDHQAGGVSDDVRAVRDGPVRHP